MHTQQTRPSTNYVPYRSYSHSIVYPNLNQGDFDVQNEIKEMPKPASRKSIRSSRSPGILSLLNTSDLLVKPQVGSYKPSKLQFKNVNKSLEKSQFSNSSKDRVGLISDFPNIPSVNSRGGTRRQKFFAAGNISGQTEFLSVDMEKDQSSKMDSAIFGGGTKTLNQSFYINKSQNPNYSTVNFQFDNLNKQYSKQEAYFVDGTKQLIKEMKLSPITELVEEIEACFKQLQRNFETVYAKFLLLPDSERLTLEGVAIGNLQVLKVVKKLCERVKTVDLENKNLLQEKAKLGDQLKAALIRREAGYDESNELRASKKALHEVQKKFEQAQNSWTAERVKLMKEIEIFSKSIYEIKGSEKVEVLTKQLKTANQTIEALKKSLVSVSAECEARVDKLELTAGNAKFENDKLRKALLALDQELTEFKQKPGIEVESQSEKWSQYREQSWMQREELDSVKVNLKRAQDVNLTLKKRINQLSEKLDKLLKNQDFTSPEEYEKDKNVVETLKEDFAGNQFIRIVHASRGRIKMESLLALGTTDIKLERLALYKPNFLRVFEEKYTQFMQTAEFLESKKKIDFNFFAQLRAILDAKFNEHLYFDEPRCFSKFSDFVYSWLSKFGLDPITKQTVILPMEQQMDSEYRILKFIANLQKPMYNSVWDVLLFREFLEEKGSLDELHFFLLARNMLYDGPELSYNIASFTIVHYVQLNRALAFVDHILRNFESNQVNLVKEKLKARAKFKGPRELIDGALVLRVLLEFYKNERKARFISIRETFEKYKQPEDTKIKSLSFDNFKDFIDTNFPFATELEKLELYRDSWNFGGGHVGPEAFYVAATESGFFIKSLAIRPFKPMVDAKYAYHCHKVSTFLQESQNQNYEYITSLKTKLSCLGIEKALAENQEVERGLERGLDKINLRGKTVYSYFYKMIAQFLQVRNIYCINKWFVLDPEQELKIAHQDIGSFDKFFETLIYLDKLETAEAREKDAKIKKIQKLQEKKLSAWYVLLDQIMKKISKKK